MSVLQRPSILVVASILAVTVPSSGRLTVADLIAGLLVVAVGIRVIGGDRTAGRYGWLAFAAALFSFALATITADDVTAGAIGFLRYAEIFVLVPVAVAMTLRDRRDVLLVAGAVIAVTVVEGGYGVHQYLTGSGASYGGEFVRAVGTFGPEQIMALGALCGYGLVVTLALALALPGRPRTGLLAVAGFLVPALGCTLSRGAWIATAAAVLALLLVADWRAAALLGATAALGIAVLVWSAGGAAASASDRMDQRITSIFSSGSAPDQSVRDRYALWHAAGRIWADHPVLGVGMKDFASYRDTYASVGLSAGSDVGDRAGGVQRQALMSPHNQYLMVVAEQGTIGALAFGGLLVTVAAGAVRRRRPRLLPPTEERFLDLVAPALTVWTAIDWMYGDIGAGPSTVLMAVLLGIVVRRSAIVPEVRRAGH